MKVVSVSRRTDIPAFYPEWFMNRVRSGYACSRNPFNPKQISTVSLQADKVAALVFWTKDPRPLLPHLDELERRGLRFLFHITLTGLPCALEPEVPESGLIVKAMRRLAGRLGARRVIWRFDPVVLGEGMAPWQVEERFVRLADALQGAVPEVRVSFLRQYRQVARRLKGEMGIADLDTEANGAIPEAVAETAALLGAAARRRGLAISSCAERFDLRPFGIMPGRCIDAGLLEEIFGLHLDPRKDPGQRPECGCIRSIDIGMYGTCRHGCVYCYAATDRALREARHDPQSPFLFGAPPVENSPQGTLF